MPANTCVRAHNIIEHVNVIYAHTHTHALSVRYILRARTRTSMTRHAKCNIHIAHMLLAHMTDIANTPMTLLINQQKKRIAPKINFSNLKYKTTVPSTCESPARPSCAPSDHPRSPGTSWSPHTVRTRDADTASPGRTSPRPPPKSHRTFPLYSRSRSIYSFWVCLHSRVLSRCRLRVRYWFPRRRSVTLSPQPARATATMTSSSLEQLTHLHTNDKRFLFITWI